MKEFLTQPWPWYFGGAMISIVLLLLVWSGKTFGMSSNLRTLCSMMGAGKFVAYMALWSVGFIAVRAVTASPMKSVEDFIAGTKTGGV